MKKSIGFCSALLLLALNASAAEVPELIKQLKDKEADTRRSAAESLGKAGKEAKAAAPALIVALKDSDLFVRTFAAQALGEVGAEPKIAVPALKTSLNDPKEKPEVLEAAISSLQKLGAPGVDLLTDVAQGSSRDANLRHKSLQALGNMGPEAKPAIGMLLDMTVAKVAKGKNGPAMELRVDAVKALGNIATKSDSKVVDKLTEMDEDKDKKLDRMLKMAIKAALKQIKSRS